MVSGRVVPRRDCSLVCPDAMCWHIIDSDGRSELCGAHRDVGGARGCRRGGTTTTPAAAAAASTTTACACSGMSFSFSGSEGRLSWSWIGCCTTSAASATTAAAASDSRTRYRRRGALRVSSFPLPPMAAHTGANRSVTTPQKTMKLRSAKANESRRLKRLGMGGGRVRIQGVKRACSQVRFVMMAV